MHWHIPTILEFTTVYSSYGAANPKDGRSLSERLKIPLISYYWDEYRPDQASSNWALLWSSTAATDVDAFYPGFTSTDLETRTWYKRTGMPIRCILRESNIGMRIDPVLTKSWVNVADRVILAVELDSCSSDPGLLRTHRLIYHPRRLIYLCLVIRLAER